MTTTPEKILEANDTSRLFLIGDGAAFDFLSELAGRIGYDEIHRTDAITAESTGGLGPLDHVVIAASDGRRAHQRLAAVLAAGDPGYLGLWSSEKDALTALLKLSADRVSKARLDRVVAPAGHSSGAQSADELAIVIAAELVVARRRKH